MGIFSVTKIHKVKYINLCKYTKLDLLVKIFAKSLDLQVNLCYNIDRNKEQGRKPTDNEGGKRYDKYRRAGKEVQNLRA